MGLLSDAQAILGRDVVAGALDMLTADLNERLRVREMEETYLAEPALVLPLPSFFLEPLSVDIDGMPLSPAPTQLVRPGTFAISADKIRLVDGGTLFRMDYLARIQPYQEERVNKVYTAYPALYLYGLLTHHATLVRDDDGEARWSRRFENALLEAHRNDARSRQSQISMRPVPRYCA